MSSVNPDFANAHFDRWAADYDRAVAETAQAELFPFDGYGRVLARVCEGVEAGAAVLDLGTGTGNLARRLVDLGARVVGTDTSTSMLERARAKVPEARFVQADLRATWPTSLDGGFDRIVSAYVLHAFELPTKIAILREASRRLAPGGKIIIGDIGFDTPAELARAERRWHDRWDADEHYWAADEALAAAKEVGLRGHWSACSSCAGVFVFEPEA